jgi:quercetin dioxygenase-like cupin family protein
VAEKGTVLRGKDVTLTFVRTSRDTDGEVHEQRAEYAPGSPFPPFHSHPGQEETFTVESGAMVFEVEGRTSVVAAGEVLVIPVGAAHRARNASTDEPAVARWETRPALRTGEFFVAAHRLPPDAGPLLLADFAHEYRDVFRVSGPAAWAVPVFGRVARILGRRLRSSEV